MVAGPTTVVLLEGLRSVVCGSALKPLLRPAVGAHANQLVGSFPNPAGTQRMIEKPVPSAVSGHGKLSVYFTRSTRIDGTKPKSGPGSLTGASGLTSSTVSPLLSNLPAHGPNRR